MLFDPFGGEFAISHHQTAFRIDDSAVLAPASAEEADAVENAVRQTLRDGFRTGDIMEDGCTLVGCTEMGRLVAERL